MSRLFEALRDAADGAFVINEDLEVVFWNQAAESILGFDRNDVAGRYCYQILKGYDEGQYLICRAKCQVAKLAMDSKPVPNYDIHVRTKEGDRRWLNMSVLSYQMRDVTGKKVIVHLFHDLDQKKIDEKLMTHLIEVINRYQDLPLTGRTDVESFSQPLTAREREILALLAHGYGTHDIANLLSISLNTVRNHIQHILQKFQVHTRLEAVAIAIKRGLVD